MTIIQAKPINEVTREPQPYPLASSATNIAEPSRIKYLRLALQLVGLTLFSEFTRSALCGHRVENGGSSPVAPFKVSVHRPFTLLSCATAANVTNETTIVHAILDTCRSRKCQQLGDQLVQLFGLEFDPIQTDTGRTSGRSFGV